MAQASIGDITLEYELHGDSSAPVIVLIRGLGTQLVEWSPVLIEGFVEAGLQVLVFDNRDVGLSSKFDATPKPNFRAIAQGDWASLAYTLEDMVADVHGLLECIEVEKVHILGISMGGMIAQLFAYQFPELCFSMISVMSSSGAPGLPAATEAAMAAMMSKPASDKAEDIIALNAANMQVYGSPGYPESLQHRLAMSKRVYERCYCPKGVTRQSAAAQANGSREAQLANIGVPSLVIHGEDDALIPLAAGEDTAKHIPGAKFVAVPGMGHNIPDSLAPKLVAIVTEFIKEI